MFSWAIVNLALALARYGFVRKKLIDKLDQENNETKLILRQVIKKTRPDTRPIPVADGWAGAEMRVFPLFDSCLRTDGLTKPLIELRVHNTVGFMRRNVSVRQGALLW